MTTVRPIMSLNLEGLIKYQESSTSPRSPPLLSPGSMDAAEDSPRSAAIKRQRKTQQQMDILESCYLLDAHPKKPLREKLGMKLNLSPRQVQIWFQNRRQKAKNAAAGISSSPGDISPRGLLMDGGSSYAAQEDDDENGEEGTMNDESSAADQSAQWWAQMQHQGPAAPHNLQQQQHMYSPNSFRRFQQQQQQQQLQAQQQQQQIFQQHQMLLNRQQAMKQQSLQGQPPMSLEQNQQEVSFVQEPQHNVYYQEAQQPLNQNSMMSMEMGNGSTFLPPPPQSTSSDRMLMPPEAFRANAAAAASMSTAWDGTCYITPPLGDPNGGYQSSSDYLLQKDMDPYVSVDQEFYSECSGGEYFE